MHLILGGRYMGKRAYAESLYKNFDFIYDLASCEPEIIKNGFNLILNLQAGTKKLLLKNINIIEFFEAKLEFLRSSVLIGDEISGGIIPIDKFERQWRDETGRLYQFLAKEADIADRVLAGLPLRLKPAAEVN